MNLSDSEDDSSSDDSPVPAKRPRADTYGASSTTSHGSVLQDESDEEPSKPQQDYCGHFQKPARVHGNYTERSSEDNNSRLSRSSVSENCSSPNENYDDYRPGLDDHEADNGDSMRPSFGDSADFYNKNSNSNKAIDETYSADYSEKSKRMMSNMGFKPGKGLGKFEHGRVDPVEASTQKGRRGLGMKPSTVGDVPANFKWTPDDSKPEAKEDVSWLPPAPDEVLLGDVLDSWLQKGQKKLTIEDETNFVDDHILKGVLNAKTIFDSLDDKDLRHARFRSNPYETIGACIFLNRAAVKMANIDAVFDFMFTSPKTQTGEEVLDKKEILYFADVCAGPGGFSEYVLYRKGWRAKGFGFTLKGPNDFKLSDFYAGTAETFNPYYGVKEDGNVFDPANLTSLKEHVLKHTDDKGVHFLMADGGFSVEGQENIQEILSKQLYLCQCLAALMLVRTGGHFVVKLFDIFTPFSVGLIYLMYRCFDKVCIHKPVTSRPANSERYLVCFWKRLGTESVEQHLFSVNSMLWEGRDRDVVQLVPLSVIQEDTGFYEYIYKSNCVYMLWEGRDREVVQLVPLSVIQEDTGFYENICKSNCVLGDRQIKHLLKIAEFSKDRNLKETSQAAMKEQCLKLWKLPDEVRTQPERLSPDDTLMKVIGLMKRPPPDSTCAQSFKAGVLNVQPHYIDKPTDLDKIKNVYDWHMAFLSSGKNSPDLRIFLSCGGQRIFVLESNGGWRSIVDHHITMPAKTLLYGEIVKEYKGQGNNQIYSKALHIIDAVMLGGVDVSLYALTERINQCNLFCSALNKPFDSQALPMRCKRLFNMEQFSSAMNNLEFRAMKRIKRAVTISTPDRINRNEMFYEVASVLFIKEIKEPWSAQMSKSSGHKYYFSVGKDKKPRSEYYIPEAARLDAAAAHTCRALWAWDPPCAVLAGDPGPAVSRPHLDRYIQRNCTR